MILQVCGNLLRRTVISALGLACAGILQERIMTIGFGPDSEVFDNTVFLVLCNRLWILQERIMTIGFGPDSEIFDNSVFLVLCNRLCTCIMALIYILCTQTDPSPQAPLRSYAAVSVSNVIATTCQYEALKYVSFSVQTLAKSAKAIPVMLWGGLYFGRRYRLSEFFHAGAITLGCSVFVIAGDPASRVAQSHSSFVSYSMGASLMLLYLGVDGLTSTWQDSLFTGFNMTICTMLALVASIGTSQLGNSIMFVIRNPDSIWWIVALSVSSAGVQLVISYTIKKYGAVVFATVMTTRQFFSVLASSLFFWTPFTLGQWFGLVITFAAMYWRVYMRAAIGRREKIPKAATSAELPPHVSIAPSVTGIPLLGPGGALVSPNERDVKDTV
eukprot:gene9036-16158_t